MLFNQFLWDMQDYALKDADLFLEEETASEPRVEQTAALKQTVAPIELNTKQLEKRAGTYFSARRAVSRQITYAKGRLCFQGFNLVPLSENIFFFEVETQTRVEFIPAKDCTVAGMKTSTSSDEYSYDRVETVSPTTKELEQYGDITTARSWKSTGRSSLRMTSWLPNAENT